MFKTDIIDTPFTTENANTFFQNITGNKYRNDNSFLATLRALLAPRIKEEDNINLCFDRSQYDENQLRSVDAKTAVGAMVSTDVSSRGT